MNEIAARIRARYERLRAYREPYLAAWREVQRFAAPQSGRLEDAADGRRTAPQVRPDAEVVEQAGAFAAQRLAAFLADVVAPYGQRWHELRAVGRDDASSQAYLDAVRDVLFRLREDPHSGFQAALEGTLLNLVLYGTAVLYIEHEVGVGPRYEAVPVDEVVLGADRTGRVDVVFRAYELPARELEPTFGKVPERYRGLAERSPDERVTVLHAVLPADGGRWPIASYHLLGDALVREAGYSAMPYAVVRMWAAAGEIYGRGPGILALRSMKRANRIARDMVIAANRQAQPPLLAADDDFGALHVEPDAINYGWLDPATGKPKVVPLANGARLDVGLAMHERDVRAIEETFLTSLMLLAQDRTMTATEVIQRAQERGVMLGPVVGRIQTELLGPMITRELQIADVEGLLPDPGDVDIPAVAIRYETPALRQMAAQDGLAVVRALDAIAPIAQLDPSVLAALNLPRAARVIAESFGVPASILRDPEDVETALAAQAQAAQAVAAR